MEQELELCEECGCEMIPNSPDTCWECWIDEMDVTKSPEEKHLIRVQLIADGFITE